MGLAALLPAVRCVDHVQVPAVENVMECVRQIAEDLAELLHVKQIVKLGVLVGVSVDACRVAEVLPAQKDAKHCVWPDVLKVVRVDAVPDVAPDVQQDVLDVLEDVLDVLEDVQEDVLELVALDVLDALETVKEIVVHHVIQHVQLIATAHVLL